MMGNSTQPAAAVNPRLLGGGKASAVDSGNPNDPTSAAFTGFNPNASWTDASTAMQGGAMAPQGAGVQVQGASAPNAPSQTSGGTMSMPASTPAASTPASTPTQTASNIPEGGNAFTLPSNVQNLLSTLNSSSLPGGNVQGSLNNSNVPGLASGQALSDQYKTAQDAAYKQASGYLDPQWTNAENQLRSQLTNQGIPQNSEAWNKAMDDFGRNKTFAYSQAQNSAVQQGNAAQAQLFGQALSGNQNQFGQNLSSGQFANSAQAQAAQELLQKMGYGTQLGTASIGANTANNQLNEQVNQNNFNNSLSERQQGINELLLQQQNPLQMYQALMQGNAVNPPNFTQTPGANVGGTDIASIIQQALAQQNNVYNTQVGSQNSQTAGYASIIAALLGGSDRRLKKNIKRIGMHRAGVPLYEFDYIWGEHSVGVMADELEKVRPDAVFTAPNGYKLVAYGWI